MLQGGLSVIRAVGYNHGVETRDCHSVGDRGAGGAESHPATPLPAAAERASVLPPPPTSRVEIGGRDGPDPVRYGDWEKNGRCIDF
jgi:hypothetical protein